MSAFHTILRDLVRSLRSIRREREEYATYALSLAAGLALCLAALYGFIEITEALLDREVAGFDNAVAGYITGWRSSALTTVLLPVTHLGDVIAYTVFMLATAVYFYFRRHNWILSLQIALVLLSTGSINIILKTIIGRERPAGEHLIAVSAQSFPSGHAMSSIAFYGFLIYLGWRYLPQRWLKVLNTAVLSLLIVTIGISRVYLGVHYPSDVVAGFAGGLCWLVVCILAFQTLRLYTRRRRNRRTQTTESHPDRSVPPT